MTIYCLPAYTLRQSRRAKSLRLQISPAKGLQVVVPLKCDLSVIPDFLYQHREWIKRHLAKLPLRTPKQILPDRLELAAVNETWHLSYLSLAGGGAKKNNINNINITEYFNYKLVISGDLTQQKIMRKKLLKWLCERARLLLVPVLHKLSLKTGLIYTGVLVRYTKTRWASCSVKKQISLNPALLFLSPQLVEHILLHELCHIVHLDHSKRFWALVKKWNAQCDVLRKQIAKAHFYLPQWLEADM